MNEENNAIAGAAWRFDPGSLRLVLEPAEAAEYSIDLRRITSSASMLDVIFEASAQRWANPAVVGELVRNLQDLFDPRDTLCGGGRDRKLDPVAHIKKYVM